MSCVAPGHVHCSWVDSIGRTGRHDLGDRVEGEGALVVAEREADAELGVVTVGGDLVMLEQADDDAGGG
jgi:hypothetical protein